MQYFFDESGCWKDPKSHDALVLGGLVFPDAHEYTTFSMELRLIQSRYGISGYAFHGCDLPQDILSESLNLIISYLQKDTARCRLIHFDAGALLQNSRLSTEDIYMYQAARFVAEMIFNDDRADVAYDSVFYEAYIAKILQRMNGCASLPYELRKMARHYSANLDYVEQRLPSIKKSMNKTINKRRPNHHAINALNKLENSSQEQIKEFVEHYDWTQLNLTMGETATQRNRFYQQIVTHLHTLTEELFPDQAVAVAFPQVKYINKTDNNAGIQAVDLLCNRFFHIVLGHQNRNFRLTDERIMQLCSIQEIKS